MLVRNDHWAGVVHTFLVLSPGGLMDEGQFANRDPLEPMVELDAGLCPEIPALLDLPRAGPGKRQPCTKFPQVDRGQIWEGGPSPDLTVLWFSVSEKAGCGLFWGLKLASYVFPGQESCWFGQSMALPVLYQSTFKAQARILNASVQCATLPYPTLRTGVPTPGVQPYGWAQLLSVSQAVRRGKADCWLLGMISV